MLINLHLCHRLQKKPTRPNHALGWVLMCLITSVDTQLFHYSSPDKKEMTAAELFKTSAFAKLSQTFFYLIVIILRNIP